MSPFDGPPDFRAINNMTDETSKKTIEEAKLTLSELRKKHKELHAEIRALRVTLSAVERKLKNNNNKHECA